MADTVAFAILQINVTDVEAYQRYALADQIPLLAKYDGSLVVIDAAPDVPEGEWDYNRTVVMQFPDRARAHAWYHSSEYQELVPLRNAASTTNFAIVSGIPDIFVAE